MHHVRMLADVVDAARMGTDRWYVTNGATAVGPVNLDLIARGVEAGKVPLESFVRHEAWKVWRPLADLAEITDEDGMPLRVRSSLTDDISAHGGRPTQPEDFHPSDAVAGAADRRDAMLLLLAAATSFIALRLAGLQRDVPAVQWACHHAAVDDTLTERPGLVRAFVDQCVELIVECMEHRNLLAAMDGQRAGIAGRDLAHRADIEPFADHWTVSS